MKTVRALLYRDIVASVLFVALAFLSLFFFVDFVDELEGVGQRGRTAWHAALAALLELPGHLYELMPIAVLIGSIYTLSRLAQTSEFTILRTGGLGPGRALALLATLGVAFGAATFIVGDFVAPWSERQGVQLKARAAGGLSIGGAGAWLKERRDGDGGSGKPVGRNVSVNVTATGSGGTLLGVRIFEFDDDGALVARIAAPQARVGRDGTWTLSDAELARWPSARADGHRASSASLSVQVPSRPTRACGAAMRATSAPSSSNSKMRTPSSVPPLPVAVTLTDTLRPTGLPEPPSPSRRSFSQAPAPPIDRPPAARALSCTPWRSDQGATKSPTMKVAAPKATPSVASSASARPGPRPPVRRMVNSEVCASRDSV